jgi:hypothetical protein
MASAVLEAFQYELEEEYVRGPAAPQEAIESWFILYYNQALLVGTLMKYAPRHRRRPRQPPPWSWMQVLMFRVLNVVRCFPTNLIVEGWGSEYTTRLTALPTVVDESPS